MIAVITVLAAFPLGFSFHSRLAAGTTYAVAYLWAFTFQTLYLQLDSTSENPAFEAGEFPWQYGLVALTIFVAGYGLVNLGHWVRQRRRAGSRSSLSTTSATPGSASPRS